MISKSVRAYCYLLLTSQVQARSKIVGKTANALDAQYIYMKSFEELLKSDYSIADNIARYQGVLEHAMSKVDFSVGVGIYMLPSNMNFNINKTQGFNNKILISESSYQLGFNNKVNAAIKTTSRPKTGTARQKIAGLGPTPRSTVPRSGMRGDLHGHQKILVQNHNDEKIALSFLVTRAALVIYHFW